MARSSRVGLPKPPGVKPGSVSRAPTLPYPIGIPGFSMAKEGSRRNKSSGPTKPDVYTGFDEGLALINQGYYLLQQGLAILQQGGGQGRKPQQQRRKPLLVRNK